jgi:hypothetical protein
MKEALGERTCSITLRENKESQLLLRSGSRNISASLMNLSDATTSQRFEWAFMRRKREEMK